MNEFGEEGKVLYQRRHSTHDLGFWPVFKASSAVGLVFMFFWLLVASMELFALRLVWKWLLGE